MQYNGIVMKATFISLFFSPQVTLLRQMSYRPEHVNEQTFRSPIRIWMLLKTFFIRFKVKLIHNLILVLMLSSLLHTASLCISIFRSSRCCRVSCDGLLSNHWGEEGAAILLVTSFWVSCDGLTSNPGRGDTPNHFMLGIL